MNTELIDVSPTRKELRIEIDAESVRREYDRVSDVYAQQASVPGFRPGRAPRSVVRQRYKNEIRSDVLRELVPQAVSDAITESALDVIGEPDVHLDNEEGLESLGDKPLAIHAHVEVLPEVKLGEYKNVEVARRVRPVTDADVEEVVKQLRESNASLVPVEDRPAQSGDTVTVSFEGRFLDPPSDEPIKADDVDVALGGEHVLEDFNREFTGARPDDVKTFTVRYPEDFNAQGLAGKTVEYTARITAVRLQELPALDDEWAKSVGEGEAETLAALRERIRESLQLGAKAESDNRLRADLMNTLTDAHQFEVPQSLVEHQSRRLLESTVRDMMRGGFDPRSADIDWQNLRGRIEEQATADLRGSILLERIAEEENIGVTDEEIEQEIATYAAASRQPIEAVRDALTKQGGDRSIAESLRHRKALNLVVENARVKDEEWRDEETETQTTQAEAAATSTTEAASAATATSVASEESNAS
ncbi:MAG: trigger factor [Pyrinomonadaceae bacterium]|nr:trigger factor [Pyrinomonadaceae bacterium]